MDYKLLSKVFYKDNEQYEKLYKERFFGENTFHFNIKINDFSAFCCITPEILNLITSVASLDKSIYETCSKLPPVAINEFSRKCLVDEIILTNDIEGVYSTRKEINQIISDSKGKSKKKRFYGLVMKYQMLSQKKTALNTCEDIRNIYNELVLPEVIDDDPNNAPDGKIFRRGLAEVTTKTQKTIHKGVYPEEKIIDYTEKALFILKDESVPFLIRLSVFHYLFGYIHPFYDGNGRTSRFISSYLLAEEYERLIGYRLSYTIKENVNEYYDAFKECNNEKNKGDLTPFVITFLRIVNKSFANLLDALYERKHNLDKYDNEIRKLDFFDVDTKELCYVLLQGALFSRQGVNKEDLCNTLEISKSTVDKRLKFVDKYGYLIVKKSGHYNYYSIDIDKLKQNES